MNLCELRAAMNSKLTNYGWGILKAFYDYWINYDNGYILWLLQSYLNFEQSFGDPARVQILYERAITDFPIYADLWLDYTRYLDKTIKVFL